MTVTILLSIFPPLPIYCLDTSLFNFFSISCFIYSGSHVTEVHLRHLQKARCLSASAFYGLETNGSPSLIPRKSGRFSYLLLGISPKSAHCYLSFHDGVTADSQMINLRLQFLTLLNHRLSELLGYI